ncbi:hypothetical protein [Mycoplasma struthionis]|nr:hypothetical protein [Mycoplasma struthionis]
MVHDIGILLKTDAVTNILKRISISSIKLNEKVNFNKIKVKNGLFNVSLYRLKKDELLSLIKGGSINKKLASDFNNKMIFKYNKKIVGYGVFENGKLLKRRLFISRLNSLV